MFFWELHTGDFPIKIWYDFSLDDFGRRLLKIYCDVSPIHWRDVAINFQKSSSKIISDPSETPLKPHGFRPLWNHSETTRFQTTLKPLWNHTVSDHSETLLKPHGFRPLWNPSETTRFQTTLKPLWNHTVSDHSGTPLKPHSFGPLWNHSETPLKPSLDGSGWPWIEKQIVSEPSSFRLVWNHLFSPRDRVWRRPYEAKRIVSTDSGTPKSQKKPQFLTLDSRIPAEGCFEHEKIAKNPQFLTFFGDFRSFFLSRKNGRMRQNESWAQSSGHFRDPQKRKKHPVFDTRPSFSLRGVHPTKKKSQKNLQFLTLDSRIPWEGCTRPKKIAKIAKNPQFLTLDTHFPWEGLHRARFSWLLGCAKLEKKRKAREREGKDDDEMVRWWWEDDDDDEMMMRWWWWWDDDDDEMTMMMMRWWWLADEYHRRFFKRNPSQTLSGKCFIGKRSNHGNPIPVDPTRPCSSLHSGIKVCNRWFLYQLIHSILQLGQKFFNRL